MGRGWMNWCPDWDIATSQNIRPLCRMELADSEDSKMTVWYPEYDAREQKIRTRISRLAILLGSLSVLICFAINLIVIPQFLWVFYVAVAVFYILGSLNHTLLSACAIEMKHD